MERSNLSIRSRLSVLRPDRLLLEPSLVRDRDSDLGTSSFPRTEAAGGRASSVTGINRPVSDGGAGRTPMTPLLGEVSIRFLLGLETGLMVLSDGRAMESPTNCF